MLGKEYIELINSNNESIKIGFDYDLTPISFEDEVENEINTTKYALQNGETYASSSLGCRYIAIECFYPIYVCEQVEEQIKRVLNPMLPITMNYYTGKEKKTIPVRLENTPIITRDLGVSYCEINIVALSPFYEVDSRTEPLAKKVNKLRFPINFIENNIFAVVVEQVETEIENKGNVEIGFIAHLKANGNVTNPYIKNNITGQIIKLNCTMNKDDKIDIINLPFNKMVMLNGVKAFNLLNIADTSFFSLLIGKNKIGVGADENSTNLVVTIEYVPKYL